MSKYEDRAFGWVQDASMLENLVKFVSIFERDSEYHIEVIKRVDKYIDENYGKNEFIKKLSSNKISLTHSEIVGRSGIAKSRKDDPCNSIGQAALPGQKKSKDYQTDWSVESFLRWAHILQFINYNMQKDEFTITKVGKEFLNPKSTTLVFRQQLLKIPYVVHVMKLINKNPLSQFEIGSNLGFIGEKGFTSVNIDLFITRYMISTPKERKSLRSDFEGSADKYARQICSWLIKAGYVFKFKKEYNNELDLMNYQLTEEGEIALEKSNSEFFIPYGMLSMELSNKTFHRTRRAVLLNKLREKPLEFNETLNYLNSYFKGEIDISNEMILDDIRGLNNIGIKINVTDSSLSLESKINFIEIPKFDYINAVIFDNSDETTQIKEFCRKRLKCLDHKYLNIINASRNSRSGKEFEFITSELFSEVYKSYLLAGASRPDIVIRRDMEFASIIDTKSYSKGFTLPASEQDKMLRYITEYQKGTNEELWTNVIKDMPNSKVTYMFISSYFKGDTNKKLEKICENSGMFGSAYTAKSLLLDIDYILETNNYRDFENKSMSNMVL